MFISIARCKVIPPGSSDATWFGVPLEVCDAYFFAVLWRDCRQRSALSTISPRIAFEICSKTSRCGVVSLLARSSNRTHDRSASRCHFLLSLFIISMAVSSAFLSSVCP